MNLEALTTPADDVDREAGHIDGERQQIAHRSEPPAFRTDAQSMINLQLEDKPTGDRRDDHACAEDTEPVLTSRQERRMAADR